VLELGTPLPGIEIKDINKYPPITPATAAGHLDGTRWVKARSMLKEQLVAIGDTEGEDPPLEIITSPPRGQYVYVRERPLMETNLVHGDSTGNHPIPSKSGNIYILFMVAEDASYIHMELYQDREANSLTKAYENAFNFFAKYESHPTFLRLDNEKSVAFEKIAKRGHVKLKCAPPGKKRANKSERAIRT
jgi:hypothetical protein